MSDKQYNAQIVQLSDYGNAQAILITNTDGESYFIVLPEWSTSETKPWFDRLGFRSGYVMFHPKSDHVVNYTLVRTTQVKISERHEKIMWNEGVEVGMRLTNLITIEGKTYHYDNEQWYEKPIVAWGW